MAKEKKNNMKNQFHLKEFLRKEKISLAVLLVCLVIFIAAGKILAPPSQENVHGKDYAEYEAAKVTQVLKDTSQSDERDDYAYRGEQTLIMNVSTGQYKGKDLMVYNFFGPLYGVPLHPGDSASIIINTYQDGTVRATVYEYNRIPALAAVIVLFCLVTALIGGKTGIRSLISLTVTIGWLFMVLIPWLIKGAATLPAVFLSCIYITAVSFTLIGGIHRKTVCAMLGTVCGIALAMAFASAAQYFARIDGLRTADIEPLLQLRQSGTPIGLRGLLTGGIVISALGAVMDVSMSISSSLEEVHKANPQLTTKELFTSGMNIGRDMVGTMTNTLILAFLGSGFTLIIYLYSLGLSFYQLMPSAYAATEVISGISSSMGMILAIPLTAFISALWLARK